MRRTGELTWIGAVASVAIVLTPAIAGAEVAGAPGPDGLAPASHGPIDYAGDTLTYDNANCEATLSGSAEVLQGDARLRANTIHMFMKHMPATRKPAAPDQPACGDAERIEADGQVFYVTPDQHARGDHAVYSADENLIVMTGGVILVRGKDVVAGDRLTIHTQTQAAEMTSDAQGRGTPGRVRGVFYQTEPGAPGAPAPSH